MAHPRLVLLALAVVACSKSDTASTKASPVPAAQISAAEFKSLSWLEGKWRGIDENGRPFFEAYRRVDDSTIHEGSFTDSTFGRQKDSSTINLRGGIVLDQGTGKPWVATRIDSQSVEFTSKDSPTHHFRWTKQSADRWQATLFSTDARGGLQQTILSMQRVKPQ